MYTCSDCGTEVSTKNVRRCGPCYHRTRRTQQVGMCCRFCWKTFTLRISDVLNGRGQFCCRTCRSQWRKADRIQRTKKTCPVCGEWFFPKKANVRLGKAQRCSPNCKGVAYIGEGHPNWSKTGRRVETSGYVSVRVEGGSWVHEHRVIAEGKIGRPLLKDEQVHHHNRDRSDNRPGNVFVLSSGDHRRYHNFADTMDSDENPFSDDPDSDYARMILPRLNAAWAAWREAP